MANFEYSKYMAAFVRLERAIIFQLPTIITQMAEIAKVVTLPNWVVPALILVGGILQATDKFIRDTQKGL